MKCKQASFAIIIPSYTGIYIYGTDSLQRCNVEVPLHMLLSCMVIFARCILSTSFYIDCTCPAAKHGDLGWGSDGCGHKRLHRHHRGAQQARSFTLKAFTMQIAVLFLFAIFKVLGSMFISASMYSTLTTLYFGTYLAQGVYSL